jgi:erythronate-4-phosphate dehydrogenase
MEGKTRGTEMIYKAACRYFGLPVRKKLGQFLPEAPLIKMVFSDEVDINTALRTVTHAAYDVRSDDAALRHVVADHHTAIGQGFDRLRKEYPVRREFTTLEVKLKHAKPELVSHLRSFGFKVKES